MRLFDGALTARCGHCAGDAQRGSATRASRHCSIWQRRASGSNHFRSDGLTRWLMCFGQRAIRSSSVAPDPRLTLPWRRRRQRNDWHIANLDRCAAVTALKGHATILLPKLNNAALFLPAFGAAWGSHELVSSLSRPWIPEASVAASPFQFRLPNSISLPV